MLKSAKPGMALCQSLLEAARLPAGQQLGYRLDVQWVFRQRLLDWLQEQGVPLEGRWFDCTRLKYGAAQTWPGNMAPPPPSDSWGNFYEPDPVKSSHYVDGDYSYTAVRWSEFYQNARDQQVGSFDPALYVDADAPLQIGNFAAVVARPPGGHVCSLPAPLGYHTRFEAAYNKASSVQGWLGVCLMPQQLPADFVQAVRALPKITAPCARPVMYIYGYSKFMLYYGKPDDDEQELRQQMGFAPKGKPVSEEILYRNIAQIFEGESIKRRYRPPEMQGLELDIFLPGRRLAFEYQGQQHFREVKHWHGAEGFQAQQRRDARKRSLCKKLGYTLVLLDYKDNLRREALVRLLRSKRLLSV